MAVVVAKFEMGEFGGVAPFALVVGVKDVVPRTVFDAGGRAQSGGDREHLACFWIDADGPASPMGASVRFTAEGFVGGDPKKAFGAEPGAKVVFVIVAADFPVIANGLEKVALVVAVDVFHPSELAALRGVNPAFVFQKSERLRNPPRPKFEGGLFRRAVSVFDDVNFSGARADHHASVLPKHHGADFHAKMIRRQGVYLVVFGFVRRGGQGEADRQNCEASFQSLHKVFSVVAYHAMI